jgi:hypothetical protein
LSSATRRWRLQQPICSVTSRNVKNCFTPPPAPHLLPQFYWNNVSAHIQTAIRYLNVTSRGRQWIAGLYSNVFCAERGLNLSGPKH